ncbi:hypothetical protein G9A89_017493 [Geosiphon pyriformis]|nr:hypothetical protein G9A89_017493 [Geosiphon pyriformis]
MKYPINCKLVYVRELLGAMTCRHIIEQNLQTSPPTNLKTRRNRFFGANFQDHEFEFEPFVRKELKLGGMSCVKKVKKLTDYFNNVQKEKNVVCKHFIIGTCFRGPARCPYLHEMNLSKMSPCPTMKRYGICDRQVCVFRHNFVTKVCSQRNRSERPKKEILFSRLNEHNETQKTECMAYQRGFCPDGPNCTMKHVRRIMCQFYLMGFCAFGKNCSDAHPKHQIIPLQLKKGGQDFN